MRSKADIESAGLSGLPVSFADVARVSRSGRVVTLRHNWRDNTDARIWSTVRRAFARGAGEIADRTGKTVEVYSADGVLLLSAVPDLPFARK